MHSLLKTQLKYLKHLFFAGLKPNLTKCEIWGMGALKMVQVAVCGMTCIDQCSEAIKILVTYFLYKNRMKEECNFLKIVSNVQSVLKVWRFSLSRNITFEVRIVVYKSLAVSKRVVMTPVPSHIIKALETIQTLWSNSNPKIKHLFLFNSLFNLDYT